MDAIVTKMEETLERKKSITNIVEKRTMVIDYIRRIHEAAYYGNSGFTNTPSLSSLSLNDLNNSNNSSSNNNCNINGSGSNNIGNNNNNNNNKSNMNGSNSSTSISSMTSTNTTNNNNTTTVTATTTNKDTSGLSTSSSNSSISSLNHSSSGNLNKLYNTTTTTSSSSSNNNNNNTTTATIGGGLVTTPTITPSSASSLYTEPNPFSSQQNMHWMNVTMIQRQDFDKSVEIQKRLLGWFCLGFSLAPLIATDKGPAYIRSLVQLMEEYDYHFELGSAMQGVKVLLSKKQPTHTVVNENEHIKSKIVKIGTTVVYEFLKIFNISMAKDLDYFQVVFGLLEILEQIYKKIDKETCSSKYVYEALLKVDSRLKHNIFGFLSKEIDKMSMAIIREQLDFTLLSTSIKDKDIQQHLNIQNKMANSLNISQNGGSGKDLNNNNSGSFSD